MRPYLYDATLSIASRVHASAVHQLAWETFEVWKAYRSRPNIAVISTQQVRHFGQQASLVLSSELKHRGFHSIVVICLVCIGSSYSARLHIMILNCCVQAC